MNYPAHRKSSPRKGMKMPQSFIEKNRARMMGNDYAGKGVNHSHYIDGRAMDRKEYSRVKCLERMARKMKAEGSYTTKQWGLLKEKYQNMCLCCKRCEPDIKLTQDHIIPLSKGGTNYIENIQPLCGSCNSRKATNNTNYINKLEKYGI